MKFASIWLVWLFSVPVVGAQEPGQRPPMAEEIFKNVQILKGIPVDQFMGTMGFFSASTGLNCTDCHVDGSASEWARYADEKALKQTARKMMLMVDSINKTNFAGRQVVTCNTCHRGTSHPNAMPSLDLLYSTPLADEPGDPIQQASGQPPADQILDRYLRALGGPERVAALASFTAKGSYTGYPDEADKIPLEMYARAPGQRTIVAHSRSGDTTWTFDGRSAWIAAPATEKPVPVLAMTGQDLDGVKLESEVSFPARIKQALTNTAHRLPDAHQRSGDQRRAGYDNEWRDRYVVLRCGNRAAGPAREVFELARRSSGNARGLQRLSRGVGREDAIQVDGDLAGWPIDL
jgi:photosynthetic reaction center cytochrome c subunit